MSMALCIILLHHHKDYGVIIILIKIGLKRKLGLREIKSIISGDTAGTHK